MQRIDRGRVVLGGLVAGLVFNVGEALLNAVVLAAPMAEIATAHDLRQPTGADIALFVALGFLLGLLAVWLYAAVRPRLGAGAKTAAIVGAALWVPAYLTSMAGWVVAGLTPVRLAVPILAWGLVELVLAVLAGALVYREA
jgi:hypothetical protein